MGTDEPPSVIGCLRSAWRHELDLVASPTRRDRVEGERECVTWKEAFAVPRFARTCRTITDAKRRSSSSPLGSGSIVAHTGRSIASCRTEQAVATARVSSIGPWTSISRQPYPRRRRKASRVNGYTNTRFGRAPWR
jgi:hypothetical protein